MKHLVATGLLLMGGIVAMPAQAAGSLADVAVIDRDTGQRLETYYRHGEYWVAGEPGARYAISIRNRLGERLLAVTSVDGVNVVTGQSAGWDQPGYVLNPQDDYQITGWRKSDVQVAAFAFTPAPHSYAARTGRPENIGVIGVALFREQPIEAPLAPPSPPIASEGAAAVQSSPPSPLAEEAAPPASKSSDSASNRFAPAPAPAPSLGTAHGAREYSYAAHTHFVRRQWQPDEIIRIRYDSLDNLIAMGIARPERSPTPPPSAFPGSESPSYVPDPPPFAAFAR